MTTNAERQAAFEVTPMQMLQIAVEKGADIDKLQQLMELQTKWEEKEAKKAYTIAKSEFMAECPTIDKTREAYNNRYAGLAETLEQIKDLLSKHGLSHSWKVEQNDGTIKVTTCITHVQGHQECTSFSGPPDNSGKKNSIQAIASTATYLQRYGLFAILGLASKDMDDDGASAEIEWITEEKVLTLNDLIQETGVNEKSFLGYMGAQSLERIQSSAYDKAVKALESKRKK